jgi:plastocyanin
MLRSALVALALSFGFVSAAHAGSYSAITVSDGGSIKGNITFGGKLPAAKTLTVDKDTDVCGKSAKDESLIVGKSNGLANAVVFLSDITKGAKAESKALTIDQKACVYAPHVQATTLGSNLNVLNSDPILHNVHAKADAGKGSSLFNLALPTAGMKQSKALKKAGVMNIKCDAGHTWMSAYVHVFEHPYFVVTSDDGAFELKNVPAGTYTLTVWHEKLGSVTQKVTVTAGGVSTASAELK